MKLVARFYDKNFLVEGDVETDSLNEIGFKTNMPKVTEEKKKEIRNKLAAMFHFQILAIKFGVQE